MNRIQRALVLALLTPSLHAQPPPRRVRETLAQWQAARSLSLNVTQRWCSNADAAPQLIPPPTIASVGVSGGTLIVLEVPPASALGDTVVATYHTVPANGQPRVVARVRMPSFFSPNSPTQVPPAPFAPSLLSSIGWAGDIAHSNGAAYDVEVFPSTGSAWRLSVAIPPRAVSNAERSAYIAELLTDAKATTVEQLPEQTREHLANAASIMPLLQDLRLLRDGTLWVKPTPWAGDALVRWDIYARDGARVGRTQLPRAARVVDGTRDWILAIERGIDDVPIVVRYAVPR